MLKGFLFEIGLQDKKSMYFQQSEYNPLHMLYMATTCMWEIYLAVMCLRKVCQ